MKKCKECKNVLSAPRDLTKHLEMHTGGRTDKKRKVKVKVSKTSPNLIKCMECKTVSPVTRDLTKHLTTHTGGRTDEKRKVIIIYLGLQK